MRTKKEKLERTHIFSESLRKTVVRKVESGELTVKEACRVYGIGSRQSVYDWIYKYSRTLKKSTRMVVEEESVDKRIQEMEAKIKDLEAALGRKQLESDLWRHVVDIASEQYGVDFKKKFGDKASKGKSS